MNVNIGNYGEIFATNLTKPLGIPRNKNNLITNGGLMYAPSLNWSKHCNVFKIFLFSIDAYESKKDHSLAIWMLLGLNFDCII